MPERVIACRADAHILLGLDDAEILQCHSTARRVQQQLRPTSAATSATSAKQRPQKSEAQILREYKQQMSRYHSESNLSSFHQAASTSRGYTSQPRHNKFTSRSRASSTSRPSSSCMQRNKESTSKISNNQYNHASRETNENGVSWGSPARHACSVASQSSLLPTSSASAPHWNQPLHHSLSSPCPVAVHSSRASVESIGSGVAKARSLGKFDRPQSTIRSRAVPVTRVLQEAVASSVESANDEDFFNASFNTSSTSAATRLVAKGVTVREVSSVHSYYTAQQAQAQSQTQQQQQESQLHSHSRLNEDGSAAGYAYSDGPEKSEEGVLRKKSQLKLQRQREYRERQQQQRRKHGAVRIADEQALSQLAVDVTGAEWEEDDVVDAEEEAERRAQAECWRRQRQQIEQQFRPRPRSANPTEMKKQLRKQKLVSKRDHEERKKKRNAELDTKTIVEEHFNGINGTSHTHLMSPSARLHNAVTLSLRARQESAKQMIENTRRKKYHGNGRIMAEEERRFFLA